MSRLSLTTLDTLDPDCQSRRPIDSPKVVANLAPTKASETEMPIMPTPSRHELRYAKIRQIGTGTFGCCWLVADNVTGSTLVMKEVSLKNLPTKEQRATKHEVRVLQAVKHPHCIAYMDSFVCAATYREEAKLCICMEWASGGDLASLISQRKRLGKRFTEPEILRFAYQICDALGYCHHELKLLHRDLKPANIFIGPAGEVKVGDFGISRFLSASEALAHTQCGTPLYMSPEMARGQSYSRAADAWAVGCIIYEMMTLTAPWIGQLGARAAEGGIPGLMRRISRDVLQTTGLQKHYSVGLVALLSALCAREPKDRPSLSSVTQWPILRAYASPKPRLPRIARPSKQAYDATGTDQHAAAMAIQRSFKRSFPARRNRLGVRPQTPGRGGEQVEGEADIDDDDPSSALAETLLLHEPDLSEPSDAIAAADHARRAAREEAEPALLQQGNIRHREVSRAHCRGNPPPRSAPTVARPSAPLRVDDGKLIPGFLAAPAFKGRLEGYIFKRGERGLGYYRDVWRVYHLPANVKPSAQRQEPAPPSSRPSRPTYAAAEPLSSEPDATGVVRAPSAANLPRDHSSAALTRAPGSTRLPVPVPHDDAAPATRLPRTPSAARVGRGLPRTPSTAGFLQPRGQGAAQRADIRPTAAPQAAQNEHVAAVNAAEAAKKALEAAAVARRAADELRTAQEAKERARHDTGKQTAAAQNTARPSMVEQGSRVERATRQHAFGDAIVARRELRNAINGGRPEEVVAAAAAAQKIIDSFKRSQARRRSKALVPQQRQTLNRRVGAHARPSSGAPTSARAVVAGASRRGPSAAELKNHFEQPPFRAGAAPPERGATPVYKPSGAGHHAYLFCR